ncbi:hypothetical protein VFPPC_05916 [Pochonia chlamydosporia 170]|uniref:Uncharacterized protein n=1 Tax=Pochonia chlamydosporia 170 TaxID=1380566 RepID=A0A179FI10_METCM|nr:hypothetical protein VFPPC_05916 [Pochonia chlamydosporia 170]OAQ64669.1 hypothetical protein VFPPC_05916 [Pochonia chlamydosporia 170]
MTSTSTSPSPPHTRLPQTRPPPPASTASSTRRTTDTRREPFPFSMTRPFRPNPTSTSVAPSTAEGRAIPVDDTTAEHRTSALRELNSHYPSRHRYAKSTGAQSSTYSEPVIVRSYYSPAPSRHDSSTRRRTGRGGAGSEVGGPVAGVTRALPFSSKVSTAGNGMLSTMARVYNGKMPSVESQQDTHLPPVEAFTFKSFMANMEADAGTGDINSDLDRIAEICARSRYSLSNQYEVHYAPHGSGTSFLASTQGHEPQGPTLQAVSSDDEGELRITTRRRRQAARRNSRAMGTLETIMSSSRSSDEEKSKKKSASELANEVRGRRATKTSGRSSPTTSSRSEQGDSKSQEGEQRPRTPARRPSTSLALIDSSRQNGTPDATPRTSATALVSEPALPRASNSQLETRTTAEGESRKPPSKNNPPSRPDKLEEHVARGSISSIQDDPPDTGILSALTGWLPWKSNASRPKGRAEGSLRDLLKSTETKGKSAESIV